MPVAETPQTLHATAVAVGSAGVLIKGKSGSGKSDLALQLLALGATLVADDQVVIMPQGEGLLLTAPPALKGRIEARGLGILRSVAEPAWARLVVDMDLVETNRLPPTRETVIAGVTLRLIHRVESAAFPAMINLLLQGDLA